MRDLASCFADHAVNVAEKVFVGCGSAEDGHGSLSSPLRNTITSCYRTVLCTRKELLIKVTWLKGANTDVFGSVTVEDYPPATLLASKASGSNSYILKKKKGIRSFVTGNSVVVSLNWDITAAKFAGSGSSAEPVKDFYLIMIADAEFALLLGDTYGDFTKKFEGAVPAAAFSLYSRREQVAGGDGASTLYTTRARLREGGKEHEISVRCKGDEADAKDAELYVSVDRKKLLTVESLRWNFRGNQTVFLDGAAVDVMWDVRDWWFSESAGAAAVSLRPRSSLQHRLWLVEEELDRGASGVSLMIQAFKS